MAVFARLIRTKRVEYFAIDLRPTFMKPNPIALVPTIVLIVAVLIEQQPVSPPFVLRKQLSQGLLGARSVLAVSGSLIHWVDSGKIEISAHCEKRPRTYSFQRIFWCYHTRTNGIRYISLSKPFHHQAIYRLDGLGGTSIFGAGEHRAVNTRCRGHVLRQLLQGQCPGQGAASIGT